MINGLYYHGTVVECCLTVVVCMKTVDHCVEYWKHVTWQTQRPISGGYFKTTVQPQTDHSSRFTQLPVETILRRRCQVTRGRCRPSYRSYSCSRTRRCCSAGQRRKWGQCGAFPSSSPTYSLSRSRDGMHEIVLHIA